MRFHDLDAGDRRMMNSLWVDAYEARERAYAPYSHYKVGAAIFTEDGSIFSGCNVECADYDGTHAEEAALAAMVMAGKRKPLYLMVLGGLEAVAVHTALSSAPPCGKCRQKLMEFCEEHELKVFVKDGDDWQILLLDDLLPWAFGPKAIGIKP